MHANLLTRPTCYSCRHTRRLQYSCCLQTVCCQSPARCRRIACTYSILRPVYSPYSIVGCVLLQCRPSQSQSVCLPPSSSMRLPVHTRSSSCSCLCLLPLFCCCCCPLPSIRAHCCHRQSSSRVWSVECWIRTRRLQTTAQSLTSRQHRNWLSLHPCRLQTPTVASLVCSCPWWLRTVSWCRLWRE